MTQLGDAKGHGRGRDGGEAGALHRDPPGAKLGLQVGLERLVQPDAGAELVEGGGAEHLLDPQGQHLGHPPDEVVDLDQRLPDVHDAVDDIRVSDEHMPEGSGDALGREVQGAGAGGDAPRLLEEGDHRVEAWLEHLARALGHEREPVNQGQRGAEPAGNGGRFDPSCRRPVLPLFTVRRSPAPRRHRGADVVESVGRDGGTGTRLDQVGSSSLAVPA